MNDLLKEALTSNSQAIDSRINEIYGEFADPDTREVRDAELYSLTAGGKRIRAFLVNEFCRACGGNVLDSLDFADRILQKAWKGEIDKLIQKCRNILI